MKVTSSLKSLQFTVNRFYFADEEPFRYQRYKLFDIRLPIRMLPKGIREYIRNYMRGRPLCGSVRRVKDEDMGQCVIVSLTGRPRDLTQFEEFLKDDLEAQDLLFFELVGPSEKRRRLPHQDFNIIRSGRGAVRGPNSDEGYDYVSLSSSDRGSKSDQQSI